jgi:hypothetical protein
MAKSDPMTRLAKLEQDVGELKQAVLQITEVLVDQSSRMDSGFRAAHDDALELRRSLTERLDRLIAVTIEERTQGFGRLRELERRVERLEERVGTT